MSEITRAYAVYKSQQYNASYSAGEWSVDIPSGSESSYSQSNHTYPIELHAFDAAGNESRYAKALFTVDTSNIHCKFNLQILFFEDRTVQSDIRDKTPKFCFAIHGNNYRLGNHTTKYRFEVRRCDCVMQ